MKPRSIDPDSWRLDSMEERLAKTLCAPDFEEWRRGLWREISSQAIGNGWVPVYEVTKEGVIDHTSERWKSLWDSLVRIV